MSAAYDDDGETGCVRNRQTLLFCSRLFLAKFVYSYSYYYCSCSITKPVREFFLDLSEPVVIEVAMIVVVVDSYDNSKNYRIDCDYYLWWLLKT